MMSLNQYQKKNGDDARANGDVRHQIKEKISSEYSACSMTSTEQKDINEQSTSPADITQQVITPTPATKPHTKNPSAWLLAKLPLKEPVWPAKHTMRKELWLRQIL